MNSAENGTEQSTPEQGPERSLQEAEALTTSFDGAAQRPVAASAAVAGADEGEAESGAPKTDVASEDLRDAAVSEARAERIEARDSVIGVAQADAMDLRDGLVGIMGAERIEVGQSFIGLAGANELHIQDSTVLFAGGTVEGENVQVMLTPRQAAVAGAAFALVFAVARWIFSTEKNG